MKKLLLMRACCVSAHAEVLDYVGAPLTIIPNDGYGVAPVPAFLSGSIIVPTLGANLNNQQVTPVSFAFNEDMLSSVFQQYEPFGSAAFYFSTSATGAITGWNISMYSTSGPGSNSHLDESASITTTGDSYSTSRSTPDCAYNPTGCFNVSAISSLGGTWSVAAPEIDPSGAVGAFLLLAGGLAVLRGRRKLES
jgi:hypothetical protein